MYSRKMAEACHCQTGDQWIGMAGQLKTLILNPTPVRIVIGNPNEGIADKIWIPRGETRISLGLGNWVGSS